jgi:hypothetical protein
MERKRIGNNTMRTISGSYPTREAYESGLLLPLREQPIGAPRHSEAGKAGSGSIVSGSGRSGSGECLAARNHAESSTCEFRDYCNHLYSVEFTCNCATAWKKRAGIALPTSA